MDKNCKRCGLTKDVAHFRPDHRYKDGFGSWCRHCHKARNSEWAKENRKRLTEKAKKWRALNVETWRETYRSFHNRNKDVRAAAHAEWAKNNTDLRRASDARHRAAQRRAMPAWVDERQIKEIYRQAVLIQKRTGVRMHVDHIVPLQHDLVCGLHVPWNLQIIPGSLNESKRNKWPFVIEEAYRQPEMFVAPPAPKPRQKSIFEDAAE